MSFLTLVFARRAGGGRTGFVPSHPPVGARADAIQFADVLASRLRRAPRAAASWNISRCCCCAVSAWCCWPLVLPGRSFQKAARRRRRDREGRQTIVLLDTSASMRREGLWPRACAVARRYLEKASSAIAWPCSFSTSSRARWSVSRSGRPGPRTSGPLWQGSDWPRCRPAGWERTWAWP